MMRLYKGFLLYCEYVCEKCGAFSSPVEVGTDEGPYTVCPECKGSGIGRIYRVDHFREGFESKEDSERFVDRYLKGDKE